MIYFIGNSELIKIGFTDNIQSRIGSLEDSIPFPFDVFGVIEGDEMDEHYLHNLFRKHHYYREWFHNCEEIFDYIALAPKLNIQIKRKTVRNRHFGSLKMLRLKAGLTLKDMGDRLGIHHSQIDKFEKKFEQGSGSIKSLHKYLNLLGYEIEIAKKDKSGGSLNSQG